MYKDSVVAEVSVYSNDVYIYKENESDISMVKCYKLNSKNTIFNRRKRNGQNHWY